MIFHIIFDFLTRIIQRPPLSGPSWRMMLLDFNVSKSRRIVLSLTPKKVASVALVSIMFSRTFSRTFHCPVSIMRLNRSLWRSVNSSRTFSRTYSRTSVSFCKLFALFLRNVTLTPPSTSHNYPFEIFAIIALFSDCSGMTINPYGKIFLAE